MKEFLIEMLHGLVVFMIIIGYIVTSLYFAL